MAWEMQSQMTCFIRPSLEKYFEGDWSDEAETEAARILCYQRTEGETDIGRAEDAQARCDDDVSRLGLAWAIEAIAQYAEEVATTTNGAHAFYCDHGGWCEVPFVDENEGEG